MLSPCLCSGRGRASPAFAVSLPSCSRSSVLSYIANVTSFKLPKPCGAKLERFSSRSGGLERPSAAPPDTTVEVARSDTSGWLLGVSPIASAAAPPPSSSSGTSSIWSEASDEFFNNRGELRRVTIDFFSNLDIRLVNKWFPVQPMRMFVDTMITKISNTSVIFALSIFDMMIGIPNGVSPPVAAYSTITITRSNGAHSTSASEFCCVRVYISRISFAMSVLSVIFIMYLQKNSCNIPLSLRIEEAILTMNITTNSPSSPPSRNSALTMKYWPNCHAKSSEFVWRAPCVIRTLSCTDVMNMPTWKITFVATTSITPL
mmetsp:Transcript_5612/g.8684  ORF Transcript_5612/g.8684 Transcript_5612/m.8684 type:complete len:317 (-) Transcript_5612:108-1058(-)